MKKRIAALAILVLALFTLMMTGCGSKDGESNGETASQGGSTESAYRDDVALTDIRDAVAQAYGANYLPSMTLDAEALANMYGVTEDMYEEALGEVPMISVQVDTLILVKAKSDRVEDVKAAFENYRTYQLEEGMNYPMNVPKIEASEVAVYGDYVCYIMLGVIEDDLKDDEAAMLTAFQEQNQIAKTAIETALTR